MKANWNRLDTAGVVTIAALMLAIATGWLFGSRSAPETSPSEYEIVSNTFGTFLLDRASGDTWKWYVEHDDDDEIVGMGWQFHQKPVRLNTATMENYRSLMGP